MAKKGPPAEVELAVSKRHSHTDLKR